MKRLTILAAALLIGACSPGPVPPEGYAATDNLVDTLLANVERYQAMSLELDLDHSRLGAEAGSHMPPARVLLVRQPVLEAALLQEQPLVALDLPLRVLAYEETDTGEARVIWNTWNYVARRYQFPSESNLGLRYTAALGQLTDGVSPVQITAFSNDQPDESGIITVPSSRDFADTLARVNAALSGEDDVVMFGEIDFQAVAGEGGIVIPPTTLILAGGPEMGAKAMARAPTLGLDAFCQKVLVWQDEEGQVHVSYNDLLAIAARQEVPVSIPLRAINRRLSSTIGDAL